MQLTRDNHDLAPRPRLNRAWVAAIVSAALWLIFELDRRTGSAPVQHLYYLPIVLASLRMGPATGVFVSLIAIALYHIANLAHFTMGYTDTDVVQTALFVFVGIVTAKLAADGRRLRALAATDDLTGLHNLRSFEARLAVMVRAARRSATPMAMLVLDVDCLKALNDAHGHRAGAEAVRLVGRTLAMWLPADAVACRYGGDEFAIAIASCPEARARAIAEQLRRSVYALEPVLAGVRFPIRTLSISVGIACLDDVDAWLPASSDGDARTGETLFAAADEALYIAKRRGRNRVSALA
jgi:diguanylate cyclase (GGDEF)-like protein